MLAWTNELNKDGASDVFTCFITHLGQNDYYVDIDVDLSWQLENIFLLTVIEKPKIFEHC